MQLKTKQRIENTLKKMKMGKEKQKKHSRQNKKGKKINK